MKITKASFVLNAPLTLVLSLLLSSCGNPALDDARAFMDVQDYDNAQTILDLELKADPKNTDIYLMLGELELSRGNQNVAEESFNKVVLLEKGKGKAKIADVYFSVMTGQDDLQQIGPYIYEPYASSFIEYAPDRSADLVNLAIGRSQASVSKNQYDAMAADFLRYVMTIQSGGREDISNHSIEAANVLLRANEPLGTVKYAELAGDASPDNMGQAAIIINDVVSDHDVGEDEYMVEVMVKAQKWNPALKDTASMVWYTTELPNSWDFEHPLLVAGDLKEYAEVHSDSRFARFAIDRADEIAWGQLKHEGAEGWQGYLDQFPEGQYVDEARSKFDALNWIEVRRELKGLPRSSLSIDRSLDDDIEKLKNFVLTLNQHWHNFESCSHREQIIDSVYTDIFNNIALNVNEPNTTSVGTMVAQYYFDDVYEEFNGPAKVFLTHYWLLLMEQVSSEMEFAEKWRQEKGSDPLAEWSLHSISTFASFVRACEQFKLCDSISGYETYRKELSSQVVFFFENTTLRRIREQSDDKTGEVMALLHLEGILETCSVLGARFCPVFEEVSSLHECIIKMEQNWKKCLDGL